MNTCVHMGRLTKDPEVRTAKSGSTIARFSLAVDRRFKREGEPDADFLNFVAFKKTAEFIEKYCKKGTKLLIQSHCQNDNYMNRDGQTVYRDVFVVENVEFAESKASAQRSNGSSANNTPKSPAKDDGFMNIPNGISEEEMPFA